VNTERREATRLAALKTLQNLGSLAEIIADSVEAALSWQPPLLSGAPEDGTYVRLARWGCGCDASECVTRRDQMQDASPNPEAIVAITCITHGLQGRSHAGLVRDGMSRLDAQAMLNLDLAHQEQCR
jgi:hypothetical protein